MSKETILQHWIYLQEVDIETVDRCNTLPNTPADSIILTQTLYLTHTHWLQNILKYFPAFPFKDLKMISIIPFEFSRH